ncbi:hypothetical protein GT035_31860 [Streptomyces sp. SID4913]|nr:NotI family restriction endonuclease [Streptomyces sp. SID4913]MYY06732.1 hypothetical protein [Streptomyces sp. SID4913]
MSGGGASKKAANNVIGEWFGHRVYPVVAETPESLSDQEAERCPFLTKATGKSTGCVKQKNSKGVCTISSTSNGPRQDWLACPFRALDDSMLIDAAHRLFGYVTDDDVKIIAATVLADKTEADDLRKRVAAGKPSIVYFQNKLGGEISISPTDRSPEFSFDATMIELLSDTDGALAVGRYGIFEIQTMDFHGTYRKSVELLRWARHAHKGEFGESIATHPQWLSEGIEGPNIANAFKRTFYQMMFKFQIGAHDASAGCIFAIPRAVWESWQRHLGRPDLVEHADGTWRLVQDGHQPDDDPPAWIYVFDVEQSETQTPNSLNLWRVIGTNAAALSHYTLDVSPEAALATGGSVGRLRETITMRLAKYLPELRPAPKTRHGKANGVSKGQMTL